jgi:methyl-accepting chemotaxis protein
MFNQFGLRFKLMAGFSLIAAILVGVSYTSYSRLKETVSKFDHVVTTNFPNYVSLSQIVDNGRRLNIMIARVTGSALSPIELKNLTEELQSIIVAIEKAKKAYLSVPFATGEEEMWNLVEQRLKACVEHSKKVLELSRFTKPEELKRRDAVAEGYEPLRKSYRESMEKLMVFQSKETEKWSKMAQNGAESGEKLILILALLGGATALIIGALFSTSISKAMTTISQQLSQGADEVASASSQISSTAEQLSSSSIEQASAIQETASSVEEMSSMVGKNAENAKRSATTARDGMAAAETGKNVVTEMLTAMTEIDSATKEIGEVVKLISQIESKTKVIDDIVFKTQLLSFNASVEAARAGEHGKGFAVVAEEVGNLAQMSGNAAKEISDMLSQSLDRVDRLITSSKQKVEVGLQVGKRCGDVLEDLVTKVSQINDMANEIAGASEEQARGVTEINKAMNQMDQMTQQNASAAQQSASSSGELAQQAESMRASVGELLQLLHGSHASTSLVLQRGPMISTLPTPLRSKLPGPLRSVAKSKLKAVPKVPSSSDPGFDEAA